MRVKFAHILVCLSLCLSLAAVLFPASAVDAATPIYVDASCPDDTGDGTSWATAKKYIQSGINIVDDGGAVNVAAGTYVEQVIINKSLTLSGIGNPMIQAPASPAYYTFPEGDTNQWEPVVLAFGGTADGNRNIAGAGQVTVNMSGITVDGNARVPSPTSRRAVGILYRNVLGGVSHCSVQNMGYSTASINSWCIMAYGTSGVTFHGNTVSGYAKGGFVVNGSRTNPSLPKPNGVIDGNTVTGPAYDPLMTLAPNGIQIGWGATGSVTNNTVTQNGYPDTTWGGSGVLIQSSPNVLVEGNMATGNDYGIATAGYESPGAGSYCSGTIVRNNTVEGNGQGIRIERRCVDTLVENNSITGNEEGIHVGSAPLTYPIPPVSTDIHCNMIYGNTSGLFLNADVLPSEVDATNNWWGCAAGPGAGGCDNVTAGVDYTPWNQAPPGSGASVGTITGTGTAVLSPSSGGMEGLTAMAVPAGGPDLTFGHGFFYFTNCCLTPGQEVTLTITLPSAVPTTTQYWKYGPTPGNASDHWYQIDLGSNDGDNIITITLTDGAIGDDDLTADGAIVDQGGPGWPGPSGGAASSAPAFPSIYIGIGGALGAGILAYFVRRRLAHS